MVPDTFSPTGVHVVEVRYLATFPTVVGFDITRETRGGSKDRTVNTLRPTSVENRWSRAELDGLGAQWLDVLEGVVARFAYNDGFLQVQVKVEAVSLPVWVIQTEEAHYYADDNPKLDRVLAASSSAVLLSASGARSWRL